MVCAITPLVFRNSVLFGAFCGETIDPCLRWRGSKNARNCMGTSFSFSVRLIAGRQTFYCLKGPMRWAIQFFKRDVAAANSHPAKFVRAWNLQIG